MRILVVSSKGHGVGIGQRLRGEGHEVVLKGCVAGEGILPQTAGSLRQIIEKKLDLVLAFGARLGDLSAYFIDRGFPVVGSSPFSEMMEYNESFRKAIVPYLISEGDVVPITNGIVYCGWFDGQAFVPRYYRGYAYKRLFPGDIGPLVACSGAVLGETQGRPEVFTPALERSLGAAKYMGVVVAHDETVSAFLYPGVTECMCVMLRQPLGVFFGNLVGHKAHIKESTDWVAAIHISLPPYPGPGAPKLATGVRLGGSSFEDPKGLKNLWLEDVKQTDSLQCAGTSGSLGFVTAHGRNPSEAIRRAYRCIDRMEVQDLQYRRDIGEAVQFLNSR